VTGVQTCALPISRRRRNLLGPDRAAGVGPDDRGSDIPGRAGPRLDGHRPTSIRSVRFGGGPLSGGPARVLELSGRFRASSPPLARPTASCRARRAVRRGLGRLTLLRIRTRPDMESCRRSRQSLARPPRRRRPDGLGRRCPVRCRVEPAGRIGLVGFTPMAVGPGTPVGPIPLLPHVESPRAAPAPGPMPPMEGLRPLSGRPGLAGSPRIAGRLGSEESCQTDLFHRPGSSISLLICICRLCLARSTPCRIL